MIKPRYKVFLDELPKNGNKIKPSAIKAGYSPIYADKLGKVILNNAIKANAKEIVRQIENKEVSNEEAKMMMHELIGYSREEVFKRLKRIADNDKDYASALKVLKPLSKELGVDLSDDPTSNITVPTLNITVEQQKEGLTEPLLETNTD